jgi:hypothetical protein
MKKQNETDNQRQENTIDNYFEKTSKEFDVWAQENYEGRSYLQIAAEFTGDVDEKGSPGYDFLVSYAGNTKLLVDGIYQDMKDNKFLRSIVIRAAKKFLMDK